MSARWSTCSAHTVHGPVSRSSPWTTVQRSSPGRAFPRGPTRSTSPVARTNWTAVADPERSWSTDSRHSTSTLLGSAAGDAVVATRSIRTLASPRGDELFRFATISDLHLGRGQRGYRGPFAQVGRENEEHGSDGPDAVASRWDVVDERSDRRSVGPDDPPLACARAAIAEAIDWGAELLVVKGDLCEESLDDPWDQAAQLLGDLPIPLLILPGNHDTCKRRHFEPEDGAARRGLSLTRGVEHLDVPGLRIVLVDSTVTESGWGAVARHSDEVAQLLADADTAAFVATHHQPQRFSVPLYWPHGIPGPDARRFARSLRAANPSVLVSSGHTHRNRRRRVAGVDWTEVSATNHFPATWAGYTVHEGGMSQSVRRISATDALEWSEQTRRWLGGIWALWSTGELSDRSFTIDW